jgi:hypothetical protein
MTAPDDIEETDPALLDAFDPAARRRWVRQELHRQNQRLPATDANGTPVLPEGGRHRLTQ